MLFLHELGHDFDDPDCSRYYIAVGSRFGDGEFWAQFKVAYAFDTIYGIYPDSRVTTTGGACFHAGCSIPFPEYGNWYIQRGGAQAYIDAHRTDWENLSYGEAIGLLYVIQQQIGWHPFIQAFRIYQNIPDDPQAFSSNEEKLNLLVYLLGLFSNQDVAGRFSGWGAPITGETQDQVEAQLEPLLPRIIFFGDFNWDSVVDVEDVTQVASRWRTSCSNPDPDNNPHTPNYDPFYDIDSDWDIDIVDIMLVVVHWGETGL